MSIPVYCEAVVESLIQRIYEVAVGAASWTSFLMFLAVTFDSGFPSLYFVDDANRQGSIAISVGMDENLLRTYGEYYHERNIWIQRSRGLFRPGVVRSSDAMCSKRDFLRSEWYADFCRPLNWTQGLGATVLADGTMTANIGVFSDDHRPSYGGSDVALLNALMPHLQRGLMMYRKLAASQARGRALQAILENVSTPVLLITAAGKVMFLNAAAERLITAADGLTIESGILQTSAPHETNLLRALVSGAANTSSGRGQASGGTLSVSRSFGHEPLEVLVTPLPSRKDDWLLSQPPVAAVFVKDRSPAALADDAALIRLYRLTAAEAKVAVRVCRGLPVKEISRDLNISYNTIKTHPRSSWSVSGRSPRY